MSVTINSTGNNSRQLVIAGEVSAANIISGINTALTALGWTLHDSVSSGARNCMVTKVYYANNADHLTTPTKKYMILRFDAPSGFWYVSCAENWNNTTHVATNECYTGGRLIPLPLQYDNCTLYVFASARYAVFFGTVRGEPSPWQGIFEFEREALEDTAAAGYPCFGWTSSRNFGEPWTHNSGSQVSWGASKTIFSVPRTRDGSTGYAAARVFGVNTAFGQFPPSTMITAFEQGGGNSSGYHNGMLGAFGSNQSYAWDAGKKIVGTMKLHGLGAEYPTGRLFGAKVVPPMGNVLDTVTLPVDADGFFSAAGTPANHFLLPLSGGYWGFNAVASNQLVRTPLVNNGGGVTIKSAVMVKGQFIYAATSSGLRKMDIATATWSVVHSSGIQVGDVCFDGENSLYFTTTSGVSKLNLTDDSVTSASAGTGGCVSVTCDDSYIYASHRTASTTPKIDVISISNFGVSIAFTATLPTSLPNATFIDGLNCANYGGEVFGASANPSAAGGDVRFVKVKGADGSITQTTTLGYPAGGGYHGLLWDGTYFHMLTCPSSGAMTAKAINPATLIADYTILDSTTMSTGRTPSSSSYGVERIRPGLGAWLVSPTSGTSVYRYAGFNTISGGLVFDGSTGLNLTMGNAVTMAVSDGCSFYLGNTDLSAYRISGANGVYNASANQTAHILLPA